jgi:hypothetical protein
MRYLLLLYNDERLDPAPGTPESQQIMSDYGTFTSDVQAAGVLLAGDALQSVALASSVRLRGGKTLTTDGPFAETKEQLGGFYMLNCKDLDEALQWAARVPAAKTGTIEVRPIMEF